MANVSMTQAASLAGVSKATLSKALKSGRLSYVEKTEKGYLIDTSELFRVFPVNGRKPGMVPDSEPIKETQGEHPETAHLRDLLRRAEQREADLIEERNAWREQAQRLALTDQRQVRQTGFWGRVFGRTGR